MSTVQLDLAEKLVREQPGLRIQHGGGTLVTGGFDRQHPHEMTLAQLTYAVFQVRQVRGEV